jgi:hypothetical protein
MKKVMGIIFSFLLVCIIIGCDGIDSSSESSTDEATTNIEKVFEEINETSFLTFFDLIWEEYVINSYLNDQFVEVNNIEEVYIVGTAIMMDDMFYRDSEMDYYYQYDLQMIVRYGEEFNMPIQTFDYSLRKGFTDGLYLNVDSGYLAEIDNDIEFEEYLNSTKSLMLDRKNSVDKEVEDQIQNNSTYQSYIIDSRYDLEDLLIYVPDLDVIEQDSLIYIIFNDDYASLVRCDIDSSLETLVIPNTVSGYSVKKIDRYAFISVSLTNLQIPASVEELGYNVFQYANVSNSIEVESTNNFYTSIEGVLYNKDLTKLIKYPIEKSDTTFEILNSIVEIEDYAFRSTRSLESITFEEESQLKIFGTSAFEYTKITSISIPKSVEVIGYKAFYGSGIEAVLFETNSHLKSIGSFAFSNTSIENVVIPKYVNEIGYGVFESLRFINIEVAEENHYFKSVDGILFNKDITKLLAYPNRKESLTYEIPSSVIEIANYAFQRAKIKSVVIPSSVEIIGYRSFYSTRLLESVTFKANSHLKSIGTSAFQDSGIVNIIIPASVEVIGDYSFSGQMLESIEFEANSQLKSIGTSAFSLTLMTSITIPAGVEEIGEDAFMLSSVETIYVYVNDKPEGWSESWNSDKSVVWGYND